MEIAKQLPVGNLLSTPLIVSETTPISKVVGILKNEDAYEVFTQDKKRVSMIMIRDILKTGNVANEKAESLASFVPNLPARTPLAEAARLMMQNRIRALPIVEGKKLLGALLATSIIQAIPSGILENYRAQHIMTPSPACLTDNDKVSKARSLMLRRRIDHLPIIVGQKLRGVLTSSRIVFDLFHRTEGVQTDSMVDSIQRRLGVSIKGLMDKNPLTSAPSDRIADILKRMLNMKATYCVIAQFDEVQGIVTYRDFMKLIAEQAMKTDIPAYIVGLPEDPFEAEQTRTKFIRSIETLKRTIPKIEEARAVIRTKEGPERERRRYEVTVTLMMPGRNLAYSAMGFELANIFDDVQNHLKTMTAGRPKHSRGSRRFEEAGR